MSAYKWREGSRIKADPNKAGELFDNLANEDRLNAETVVEVSKPDDALLHNEFEWDDQKAAIAFREHQGRNIINSLLIVEENEQAEQLPTRYCYKIDDNSSNYTPIKTIVQSADSMEVLRKKAAAELKSFQMKYNAILAYCNAVTEMEQLQVKLETKSA